MNKGAVEEKIIVPLGNIEPHAALLKIPRDDQLLYRIMKLENLINSIENRYLYFNRVDSYEDFKGADAQDGQQLPKDQSRNEESKFEKDPEYTAKYYYDQARSRTFACCFSLENSDYIWKNYANNNKNGKVCISFNFKKLRDRLNQIWQDDFIRECNGVRYHQIFNINYGIVSYIDFSSHQENKDRLPNPIIYTYLKSNDYSNEKEFRISLSAIGLGQFVINGQVLSFPTNLNFPFDWRGAINAGIMQVVLKESSCDANFLYAELKRLGIESMKEVIHQ